MEKNKKIYKNYIYINGILLVLSIYVIFFPYIAKIMGKILPSFTKCAYLSVTGKYCPLCGGTRYFANLGKIGSDPGYLWNPFGIIVVAVIMEILFRSFSLVYLNIRKTVNKKLVIFDVIFHVIEIILFITYEITFFIK